MIAGSHIPLTKHDDADAKLVVEALRWGLQLGPLCCEARLAVVRDGKPPKLTKEKTPAKTEDGPGPSLSMAEKKSRRRSPRARHSDRKAVLYRQPRVAHGTGERQVWGIVDTPLRLRMARGEGWRQLRLDC